MRSLPLAPVSLFNPNVTLPAVVSRVTWYAADTPPEFPATSVIIAVKFNNPSLWLLLVIST